MTIRHEERSAYYIVSMLWQRAPLWRMVFICAGLLTVFFFLIIPIQLLKKNDILLSVAQASFTPPLQNSTPSSSSKSLPTIKQNAEPQQPISPPIAKEQKQPDSILTQAHSPTTANLSLATATNAQSQKNETGLNSGLFSQTYKGSIRVNGFQLPLPAGNWVMLASQGVKFTASSGTDYFLGHIKDKRLIGAVLVYALRANTATDTVQSSLTQSVGCGRTDALAMFKSDSFNKDFPSCRFIYNYFAAFNRQWADRSVRMGNLERSAFGDLAAKDVSYPQDMIAVQFVQSDKQKLLFANYLFSPETEGISSSIAPTFADSDWYVKNISQYPEKMAYIEKMKTWAASFWTQFQLAFIAGEQQQPPAPAAS